MLQSLVRNDTTIIIRDIAYPTAIERSKKEDGRRRVASGHPTIGIDRRFSAQCLYYRTINTGL